MTTALKRAAVCLLVNCLLISPSMLSAENHNVRPRQIESNLDKDYYTILLSLTLLLPELVEFNFADNGTVALSSDLWDGRATGSYAKRPLILKGQAATPKFFDIEMDEEIMMIYDFTALALGLRDFFLLGIGTRQIKWFSDNTTSRELILFEGPGI